MYKGRAMWCDTRSDAMLTTTIEYSNIDNSFAQPSYSHLIKLGIRIFGIASDGPIKMMNDRADSLIDVRDFCWMWSLGDALVVDWPWPFFDADKACRRCTKFHVSSHCHQRAFLLSDLGLLSSCLRSCRQVRGRFTRRFHFDQS